ncbi:FMN reductase [Virgisporangium ochraceum]
MITIVSGGLGRPSSCRLLGERLAAATAPDADARSIEVRDHAHDLTEALLTGFVPPSLREALDAVRHADALIAVTPIFKASYSGLFKMFFDVLDDSALADRPVLLAAVGGTARHALALEHTVRPLFTYLRALVVPTAVYATADEVADPDAALRDRICRAGRDLARLTLTADPRLVALHR